MGVMVPPLIYFLGPQLQAFLPPGSGESGWEAISNSVWRYMVRSITVGGMLVGGAYTLFRMRRSISARLGRAFAELRQAGGPPADVGRTERYMSSKIVFAGWVAIPDWAADSVVSFLA